MMTMRLLLLTISILLGVTGLTGGGGAASAQTAAKAPGAAQPAQEMKGPTFWMPEQAAAEAPMVDWIFEGINYVCYFFFVVILALLVIFAWKYRQRGHEKAQGEVTHNTPLELTWTIIPLILVIAIFYIGMEGYLNLRRSPLGAYEVNVTAQRWSWSFAHRNGCSDTTLHVPVGRPVRLLMQSQDVLHALYIPAFRVKQDIVPGRITDLWFTPTRTGTFQLYCAEYCGKDHSQMLAQVVVQNDDEFQSYLDECANWAPRTPDAELADAAAKRIYPRCASCHSLDGKDGTGPTWRGLWDKVKDGQEVFTNGQTLADLVGPGKTFATPEDYLRDSILNPAHLIVERFANAMPTFKGQLKDREVLAIIEFIKRLDEFDDKGKRIKPAEGGAAQDQ
jgi:cytochrome c oxidase subunit 2